MFFLTGGVGLDNKVMDIFIINMHLVRNPYSELQTKIRRLGEAFFQPFLRHIC